MFIVYNLHSPSHIDSTQSEGPVEVLGPVIPTASVSDALFHNGASALDAHCNLVILNSTVSYFKFTICYK